MGQREQTSQGPNIGEKITETKCQLCVLFFILSHLGGGELVHALFRGSCLYAFKFYLASIFLRHAGKIKLASMPQEDPSTVPCGIFNLADDSGTKYHKRLDVQPVYDRLFLLVVYVHYTVPYKSKLVGAVHIHKHSVSLEWSHRYFYNFVSNTDRSLGAYAINLLFDRGDNTIPRQPLPQLFRTVTYESIVCNTACVLSHSLP